MSAPEPRCWLDLSAVAVEAAGWSNFQTRPDRLAVWARSTAGVTIVERPAPSIGLQLREGLDPSWEPEPHLFVA
jgi:hypothetical protein